jgi:hypothetical protein
MRQTPTSSGRAGTRRVRLVVSGLAVLLPALGAFAGAAASVPAALHAIVSVAHADGIQGSGAPIALLVDGIQGTGAPIALLVDGIQGTGAPIALLDGIEGSG